MDRPPLLIRADAGVQMGTGHVMRCLALAHAWQEGGGSAGFALASATPAVEARLAGEGLAAAHVNALFAPGSSLDARHTITMAHDLGAAWVVLDGYHFDAAYQRAVVESGLRLLCIDDYGHADHYWAGLVLNQNIGAAESLYPSRDRGARLLLGTRYVLLRREFWPWRTWQRPILGEARRVLVTMGGADPDNVTLKVVHALALVERVGLEARIVVGGSNPHLASLHAAAPPCCSILDSPGNIPELMAWADVAVSSAGTTCWETAFMQVPSLVLSLADNQRPNAEGLDAAGAAANLGWHGDLTPAGVAQALAGLLAAQDRRSAMARRGRLLVDGEGGRRVAELLAEARVRVRRAAPADRELLFEWANDPLTRQMSLRTEPIGWEEHVRWFERVIDEPSITMLIAEVWAGGSWLPIGQVRIDSEGVVSIALAAAYRGQKLARPALEAALAVHQARCPGLALTAYVKPENQASQSIFRRAGFATQGWAELLGQWLLKYVRA